MADPNIPTRDIGNILSSVPGLADILLGKSETNTGTKVTSTQITPEAIQRIFQIGLEGSNSGIASIFEGTQNAAGAANSSTAKLLSNDLVARLAGEAASRSATTVSSDNSGRRANPQLSPRDAIGTLLASQILGPVLGSVGQGAAKGTSSILDSIKNTLFGGNSGVQVPATGSLNPFGPDNTTGGSPSVDTTSLNPLLGAVNNLNNTSIDTSAIATPVTDTTDTTDLEEEPLP